MKLRIVLKIHASNKRKIHTKKQQYMCQQPQDGGMYWPTYRNYMQNKYPSDGMDGAQLQRYLRYIKM